jgi:hypothetical protein
VKAILLLVGEKRRTYRMEAEILHVSRLQSCFGRFYSTSLKISKKVSLSAELKLHTRSYKISLKSSDEKSKVNRLIRSQPDFTLAYNAPTDGESEEYNLWESKLRKLYNEFTDIRAPILPKFVEVAHLRSAY